MKSYYIRYKMHETAEVKGLNVLAKTKKEAYDKAVYEEIPYYEGELPYCAWVSSVTYRNGNHTLFNTHEGKPY